MSRSLIRRNDIGYRLPQETNYRKLNREETKPPKRSMNNYSRLYTSRKSRLRDSNMFSEVHCNLPSPSWGTRILIQNQKITRRGKSDTSSVHEEPKGGDRIRSTLPISLNLDPVRGVPFDRRRPELIKRSRSRQLDTILMSPNSRNSQ